MTTSARWVSLAFALAANACVGNHERPDPSAFVQPAPSSPREDGGGLDVTPAACGEFCGETFLPEVREPRNLYFVLDRSGSMAEAVAGSGRSKLETARAVLAELLRSIGHRVRYGAAVFPSTLDPEQCGPGQQVFPATLGGLPACDGEDHPLLAEFLRRIGNSAPTGGTPTAATLREVLPVLEALDGETSVVLVTDGAPNCNLEARCDASECTLNIDGLSLGEQTCNADFNCCDPEALGDGVNGYCVDGDDTVAAIQAFHAAGIATYVVGMPGTEPYADVLDRFAVAGGVARAGSVRYYATSDAEELRDALYAIGTGVAIRCSIELETPPDDPALVNVYFDGELVPADAEDGWSWDGALRIEVHGDACARLRSGEVIDARAVFGCDTVVR